MEVISLYEMEVSPIEIISLMKNNIYNHYEEQTIINIHKTYTLQRKSLISLIHKISNKMGLKSQTFFLSVNYLDIIFSKQNNYSYNYSLLAVACLIIGAKFSENVPSRPIFKYFVNLYNNEIKDKNYLATKEILFNYEIIVCKILNYKLNYFTIYDFNFFFFGNGILKIDQLKEINFEFFTSITGNSKATIKTSSNIKKILIKIYERSRHYLDVIIENLICLKYDSLLISICIMEKSIDYVLLHEYNSINNDNSLDIEQIKFNNKKYFKQIMKEFYKIDYESLPKYEYLKIDCENYKLFDDIYDNNDNINLNQSNNLFYPNQSITHNNSGNYNININLENNCSSTKNISTIKNISTKQSPNIKYNYTNHKNNNNNININISEMKDKINYLYKKVSIPVFAQNNNNSKFNVSQIRKKHSKNKKINISRDNNFLNNNEQYNNYTELTNSKRLCTINNFYQKNNNQIQNNLRNSLSGNKNNYYLKKCNTSSSPFQKSSAKNIKHINSSCNKSKIINKIKNKKRFDGSEEGLTTNSNSIDARKNKNNIILTNKKNNKNINMAKPYIKKIIQNYDKNTNDDNKRNMNKILYEKTNRNRDRDKNIKKILISKLNGSMIRGKSLVHKGIIKNNENSANNSINNFESSPVFERNNSNSKNKINYMPYKFYKKYFPINDMSINQNNSNSIYLQETENNNNININKNIDDNNNYKSPNENYTVYKINSNYNLYNSSLTSRNSFQFNKQNQLADSLVNMKMSQLNYDVNDKKNSVSTSIIDYNYIDNNTKKKEYFNNYNAINIIKNPKNYIFKRNNENMNQNSNNTMYETNYIENYKNKKKKIFKFQNDINHNNSNFNIIDINENEKENDNEKDIEINMGNNDRRHKSFSNVNIIDYSSVISNEKNVF